MTYPSLNLSATDTADHHARACAMAANSARSSDRGLNLSTLNDASCIPSPWATSRKNRSRSFLDSVLMWAWTMARVKISSALGGGKSGTGLVSDTTHDRRQNLSQIVKAVYFGLGSILAVWPGFSAPTFGEPH